jgi:lipopolysaccharide export system permease protein
MKLIQPPLIYRYVAKEVLSPFFISIFVFTGILFLARSLKLIDLVVNKNVPALDIVLLFSYIIPRFLEIAVPMSLLLGIILGFGRLSADSELIVLRSAGLSLKRLAAPIMAIALAAVLAGLLISFYLKPWARHSLAVGLFEIARTRASAGLSPGTFNELGQLTLYAETITDEGSRLNNVIIGDRRNPETNRTFIARYGRIISDRLNRTLTLKLYDGMIPEGSGLDFNITYFEINNVSLPHSVLHDEKEDKDFKGAGEMFVGELLRTIGEMKENTKKDDEEGLKALTKYKIEFQKRIVIPFSCIFVAFIAMALGIQPSRGGKTWGAAVNVAGGIILIVIYYLLFAFASAISEQMFAPPWMIMWIPNLLLALLGAYFFQKMGSEQWLAVSQELGDSIARLFQKLKRTKA